MQKIKRTIRSILIVILFFLVVAIVYPLVNPGEKNEPYNFDYYGKTVQLKDGTTLHYRESGSGPALLLIHGYTSSSYTWEDIRPALSEKYHVLAPDVMGFGLSDKPKDAVYNYGSFAAQLREFLELNNVKRVSIAGNSMGGGIAIRFTLDYPDMVDKLILISSAGVEHGDRNFLFTLMATPGVNAFMSSVNSEFFTKRMLQLTCFYDTSIVTDRKAEAYFQPFTTKGAMNAAARTMLENDWSSLEPDLGKVKVPTLIIWGDKDKIIPPPYSAKFHKGIKNSRLEMIEKCGHMPQEEKPELTAKLILDFLGN